MACMRGFVRLSPVGVTIHRDQAGVATDLAVGVFRTSGRFGGSLGVHGGYALLPRRDGGFVARQHAFSAGPEVRVGLALDRVFAFVVARAGYSHRIDTLTPRSSIIDMHGSHPGWHAGGGLGAWGRLVGRLLYGGELTVEAVEFKTYGVVPVVTLSLSVGAWL